jgi:hypothetical protein
VQEKRDSPPLVLLGSQNLLSELGAPGGIGRLVHV